MKILYTMFIFSFMLAPPKKQLTYNMNTLINNLIQVESEWNSKAISKRGAVGLMQITPIALKDYNRRNNRRFTMDMMFHPLINRTVGIDHLDHLIRVSDNIVLAVNAYNMGKRNTDKGKIYFRYLERIIPHDYYNWMLDKKIYYRKGNIIKVR